MYGAQSSNSNTGGGSTLYYNSPSSSNPFTRRSRRSNLTATHSITVAHQRLACDRCHQQRPQPDDRDRQITISGVGGNTAVANGTWTPVNVVNSSTF